MPSWTTLTFGKHKGLTLPQVLFRDPDWFFWAIRENAFERQPGIIPEALHLYELAKSIPIPQTGEEPLVAEYWFHHSDGGFVRFELVEASRPPHSGSGSTMRLPVINMEVPFRFGQYQKGAGSRV